MAINMLFRGKLWKMSEVIGINLEKNAIWANLGCFWILWEPGPVKGNFLDGNLKP